MGEQTTTDVVLDWITELLGKLVTKSCVTDVDEQFSQRTFFTQSSKM